MPAAHDCLCDGVQPAVDGDELHHHSSASARGTGHAARDVAGFKGAPHSAVTLELRWVECPSDEVACDGAETYASFSLASRSVVSRREAMAAAFYASAGRFSVERVGTAADGFTTGAQSVWAAPQTPGAVSLWFVLRDDRGGAGTASATITVE